MCIATLFLKVVIAVEYVRMHAGNQYDDEDGERWAQCAGKCQRCMVSFKVFESEKVAQGGAWRCASYLLMLALSKAYIITIYYLS